MCVLSEITFGLENKLKRKHSEPAQCATSGVRRGAGPAGERPRQNSCFVDKKLFKKGERDEIMIPARIELAAFCV
ncbi:unnamed protein product, partial [Brenthis ino]